MSNEHTLRPLIAFTLSTTFAIASLIVIRPFEILKLGLSLLHFLILLDSCTRLSHSDIVIIVVVSHASRSLLRAWSKVLCLLLLVNVSPRLHSSFVVAAAILLFTLKLIIFVADSH